jgi:hypothetical protein
MIDKANVLSGIPAGLRDPLLAAFREVARNYAEHRWEPSELNGGKFCEVVYSILTGATSGSFPASPSKPSNMVQACRDLETSPANSARPGDRSLRILIPRVLLALYEIRNNRGVGHVGGDVNPNFLDATAVYGMSSWVLAELIRIFHAVSTQEAQESVDALIERKHPLIWEFEDMRRVLAPKMTKGDQALLLLHAKPGWVIEKDLLKWVEYSNSKVFRDEILKPFHKSRLLEYDEAQHRARISPLGVKDVEERIIQTRPL